MTVILIFISFFLSFLYFIQIETIYNKILLFNKRESFIKSSILISILSYIFCEIYSIFNILNFLSILISWSLVFGVLIYLVFKKNIKFSLISFSIFNQSIEFKYKIITSALFLIILFPLLLLAAFIPPNNWDSMAYHLPRIQHWIQNGNIYPYPTNITRQIATSPLSEYIILNFQVLASTDVFSNLVQYFALINITFLATLILKNFQVNYKGQIFAILAICSLPMALFQSTTTQTDLLASFFFLCFVYYLIKLNQSASDNNRKTIIILIAISFSLGILTKYTVALFAFPLIIYQLIIFIKAKKILEIKLSIIFLFLSLSFVLAPFLFRNYYFLGTLTGDNIFESSMSNASLNLRNMFSNSIKHIIDFISIPINSYNELLFFISNNLHTLIGVSIDEPGNNWSGSKFIVNNYLNEDTAGSLLHFLFIILSFTYIYKSKNQKIYNFIVLYFLVSFLLFSFIFRYSPWNNRLFLPLQLLLIIFSSYLFHIYTKNRNILFILNVFMIFLAIFPVYFNRAKPILGNPFYIRRQITYSPKGELDSLILNSNPSLRNINLLHYYNLINSNYILKTKLTNEQRKTLFLFEDSIGIFDADKKTVFQKTELENYFTENPIVQKNIESFFIKLPKNKNRIDLRTEYDSYEYIIWVYSKKYLNNKFYIGSSENVGYKSYSKNLKDKNFYSLQITDKNKYWSYKILN
jgi:hypothetical protein